jgi:hypothetical protein
MADGAPWMADGGRWVPDVSDKLFFSIGHDRAFIDHLLDILAKCRAYALSN